MAKAITLKINVELSKKFGGIAHGEKTGLFKKGETLELGSDELADHLIKHGFAEETKTGKR